jgi:uncharacterized protein HemY
MNDIDILLNNTLRHLLAAKIANKHGDVGQSNRHLDVAAQELEQVITKAKEQKKNG